MSDSPLPEFLVTYLADRDAQRSQAVTDFLAKLTARETILMMEAAVMGYVQGIRHPDGERCPKNMPILTQVIDACFAFPDLYQTVNAVAEADTHHESRVEWFVECQQSDGSWSRCGSPVTDPEQAANQMAAHRRAMDFEFRVSQRITTVVTDIRVTDMLVEEDEAPESGP
jgi:hypothetical protein